MTVKSDEGVKKMKQEKMVDMKANERKEING